MLILARFYLDSGTEAFSKAEVRHVNDSPSWYYEGRVLSYGIIDRSIPTPAGLPQVSDAKIRLADTDRKWRDLLAHQTPRRRIIELIPFNELGSSPVSDYEAMYIGEVVDAEFGLAYVDVTLRDRTYSWLDEQIPPFITKEFFPNLPDESEGGFIPIVVGLNRSPLLNPQGVLPAPHVYWSGDVSPDEGFGDRYAAAAHSVWDVVAVYRRLPGEAVFTLVNSAEYNITQSSPFTAFGITVDPTFIDFIDKQPDGTEIRTDIDGYDVRGPIGSLPPSVNVEVLRNPVDFFLSMIFLIMAKAGGEDRFDTEEIIELRYRVEAQLSLMYCDGAIVEPMTVREWLAQFLTSFNFDMYQKRNGLITLSLLEEETPSDSPISSHFKEGHIFLRGTFREWLPQPTFNQWQYLFQRDFAANKWATWGLYDNEDDQDTLGFDDDTPSGVIRIPIVEKEVVELHFVRDDAVALTTITRRAQFLSMGSFRQEWRMPAPEVFNQVELAQLVRISHSMGLEFLTGYEDRKVKIVGLTLDLDRLEFIVRSILRTKQNIERPGMLDSMEPSVIQRGGQEGEEELYDISISGVASVCGSAAGGMVDLGFVHHPTGVDSAMSSQVCRTNTDFNGVGFFGGGAGTGAQSAVQSGDAGDTDGQYAEMNFAGKTGTTNFSGGGPAIHVVSQTTLVRATYHPDASPDVTLASGVSPGGVTTHWSVSGAISGALRIESRIASATEKNIRVLVNGVAIHSDTLLTQNATSRRGYARGSSSGGTGDPLVFNTWTAGRMTLTGPVEVVVSGTFLQDAQAFEFEDPEISAVITDVQETSVTATVTVGEDAVTGASRFRIRTLRGYTNWLTFTVT